MRPFFPKLIYPRLAVIRYMTAAPCGDHASIDRQLPPVAGPSAAPIHFPLGQLDSKGKTMVKRCAFLLAGLVLMSSSVGCCCGLLHGNRCNPCGPSYGAGYAAPASPCGPGGCAPSYYPPGGYAPGGSSYYQGYGSSAYIGDPALSTASPVMPGMAYPTTAAAPLNSLPTY